MDKLEPAKLYITGGSPFARLCRILVDEWQIPVQEVDVPFPLPENIFELNPMGQVPVLETFGETIFPTSQIAEQLWAMTEEAKEPYWDPLADRQLLSIIMDVGTFLVSANYQHWAGLKQVGENRLGFDPAKQNLRRVQTCLAWIEERSQTWLRGDEPNICDYALACILLWSDSRRPMEWRQYTNIACIVDKLKERPSFTATAPPPWEN
jgi:glutathione S-transferase